MLSHNMHDVVGNIQKSLEGMEINYAKGTVHISLTYRRLEGLHTYGTRVHIRIYALLEVS